MTPPPRARVLVVEDELIIAADICTRLTRLGYDVAGQADQAEDAVRLAGDLRPDLVLMDIRLQGTGDGVEAAQEIRRRFRLPVVYLTAHADEATLQRAKVTEPFGYVLKPFEERELRTVVEMARYKHAAERRLADSERRYATTLASIGDAVVATDEAGRVTFLNPVAEHLTGWPLAEAAGRPLTDVFRIVNEHTRLPVENPVEKVLATGRIVGLANSTLLLARDGREYPIDDCAAPIHDDAGLTTGVVLVFRDVAEERRRAEELRQAQKMEAVGRLAGGIAHDFNNLLTVISGYASLVRDGVGPESPWREAVEQVEAAGRRAADLTRQLLTFCRHQLVQPRVIDLNQVVADSLKMLHRLLPADITLVTELHPTPATVTADPGQVEQVIVNLVLNARDAMPAGGTLRLITARRDGGPGPGPHPAGGYYTLAVADTGVGMDAATLARIWEPFFTTKEVGKGTGLGLATVYGIAKQSGGHVTVESRPGGGSTFTVALPATPDRAPAAPPPPQPGVPRGTETLLLVDDDLSVRTLAALVLRSAGYLVLEAANGIEAADLAARHSGRIHALVTDIVMPEMSGRTLVGIVRSQVPGIRVLMMTGYTEATLHQPGEGFDVLLKPFTPSELAARVRDLLDGPDGPQARRPAPRPDALVGATDTPADR
jgi:two-component system cell cycle sensor histidine kinase/response regulator CckA